MSANTKSIFLYLLPLVFLGGIFIWEMSEPTRNNHLVMIGQPLPPLNLPELFHPGTQLTNQELLGHVSLLNVWRFWCHACQNEHQTLLNIQKQYHVPIYGLNYKDKANDARDWLQHSGNPYVAIGLDKYGELSAQLNINATPETLVVDKYGIIRYRHIGALDEYTWKTVLWPLVQKIESE